MHFFQIDYIESYIIMKDVSLLSNERIIPNKNDDIKLYWTNYNDLAWAGVFLSHLIIMIALAFSYGVTALNSPGVKDIIVKSSSFRTYTHSDEDSKFIGGIFLLVSLAALFSVAWVYAVAKFAASLIFFSIISSIVLSVTSGLILLATGYLALGIVVVLFAIFGLMFFISIRSRIAFASVTLSVATESVANMTSQIFRFCLIVIFLQFVWCVIWAIAAIGVATNESVTTISHRGETYDVDECSTYIYSSVSTV